MPRRPLWRSAMQLLGYAWASPYTLFGLSIGAIGLLTGGHAKIHFGICEFAGGFVTLFVKHLIGHPTAITFGHVVLARTAPDLDLVRDHELVHVRQYERWGFLFGPAYVGASMILWFRGKNPYLDNPFEVEAYAKADIPKPIGK